jgi:Family of unknown function (DUF6528)
MRKIEEGRNMNFSFWLLAPLLAATISVTAPERPAARSGDLIVCGWDEVFILNISRQPPVKVWSWKAADRRDLPKSMRAHFETTDDCKPVEGGREILITSSGGFNDSNGGVALVERPSGKVLFYGSVVDAHSAEMLPRRRIVVAGAGTENPRRPSGGLVLFDQRQSGRPLFRAELWEGHGVVWDKERQILWALGFKQLRSYRLADWDTPHPRLEKTAEYPLPDIDGHDLAPIPGTSLLSVTTKHHVWVYDRTRLAFSLHPQLGPQAQVKCVSVNPPTGQVVWLKADKGFWWTATLRSLNPEGSIELKGQRLYKARWAPAP